jgi:hypothetical protein
VAGGAHALSVPKDILIFNWFWELRWKGKSNEAMLDDLGLRQIYGNMQPYIEEYPERIKRSTIIGGAPSAWDATNEFNFGKDQMYSFLGCSNLLWSGAKGNREAAIRDFPKRWITLRRIRPWKEIGYFNGSSVPAVHGITQS